MLKVNKISRELFTLSNKDSQPEFIRSAFYRIRTEYGHIQKQSLVVFCKKRLLKHFAKFTGKTFVGISF